MSSGGPSLAELRDMLLTQVAAAARERRRTPWWRPFRRWGLLGFQVQAHWWLAQLREWEPSPEPHYDPGCWRCQGTGMQTLDPDEEPGCSCGDAA